MFSDDNEEIMMKELISTAAARGCVERWLIQVQAYYFIETLAYNAY